MAKDDASDSDEDDQEADEPTGETTSSESGRSSARRRAGFSGIDISQLLAAMASDPAKNMMQHLATSMGSSISAINAGTLASLSSIAASVASSSLDFSALSAIARHIDEVPALTNPQDYAELDAVAGAYSPELESPHDYFRGAEEVISSFDDLHAAITRLIGKTPELPLVWRGARNANWGLHSHLFRHLMDVNNVVSPSDRPTVPQRYPDEDQMVSAERQILRIARSDWRFDHLSALETFARIQHAGGPTRLIDVTKNPYIGAWFAVESDKAQEDCDARLFALATKPVAHVGKSPAPDSTLQLDELGAARDPFWHLLPDNVTRQQLDWGTGARRRIWVPPAYDPRISAQNAAFILDGVPMTSSKTSPYFKIDENRYWRRADLLASSSIYAKMLKPTRIPRYTARNFAPTFSFRIEARAKKEIRDVMESRFGYRLSYIYPDISALADFLKTWAPDN